MSFEFDNQTRKDLNVLPDNDGTNSIFSFFDYTVTTGGKDKLLHLINSPLTEIQELNTRKKNIQFLNENKLSIQLSYDQFDFIECYLRLWKLPLRDNLLDSFMDKISYSFNPNNDYYIIQSGVNQLYNLSHQIQLFLEQIGSLKKPQFYNDLEEKLLMYVALVHKNAKLGNDKKMKSRHINKLDRLFRKTHKNFIKDLLDDIYLLDCYGSISKAIDKFGLTFAEYKNQEKPFLKFESLFHPFIRQAVPNNITMGQQAQNLCFLTGPNMTGKSTFLKALGLSAYLAHIGFPVPAKKMETSIFNGIITTINLSDNIEMGYSHYYSEVRRVKETAQKILKDRFILVIFDELFRGTNVKDALEASYRIINELTKIKDCLFIISTHINEIAEYLTPKDGIVFKCFNSILEDDIPKYDYKLKDGISCERLGIKIIEEENIFELLKQIERRQ